MAGGSTCWMARSMVYALVLLVLLVAEVPASAVVEIQAAGEVITKVLMPADEGTEPATTRRVSCVTTISDTPFVIEVTPSWSPLGAERFLQLVRDDFFLDAALFRCVPDFLVQFGIAGGNKEAQNKWNGQPPIQDDPNLGIPIQRGTISFAGYAANTRTTEVFIAFRDLPFLGKDPWETAFGVVVEGMEEVVDHVCASGCGDVQSFNEAGVSQHEYQQHGNDYMKAHFPKMVYIKNCVVDE